MANNARLAIMLSFKENNALVSGSVPDSDPGENQ